MHLSLFHAVFSKDKNSERCYRKGRLSVNETMRPRGMEDAWRPEILFWISENG